MCGSDGAGRGDSIGRDDSIGGDDSAGGDDSDDSAVQGSSHSRGGSHGRSRSGSHGRRGSRGRGGNCGRGGNRGRGDSRGGAGNEKRSQESERLAGGQNAEANWEKNNWKPCHLPFTGNPGPKGAAAQLSEDNPVKFFQIFMDDSIIEHIVVETNLYAEHTALHYLPYFHFSTSKFFCTKLYIKKTNKKKLNLWFNI